MFKLFFNCLYDIFSKRENFFVVKLNKSNNKNLFWDHKYDGKYNAMWDIEGFSEGTELILILGSRYIDTIFWEFEKTPLVSNDCAMSGWNLIKTENFRLWPSSTCSWNRKEYFQKITFEKYCQKSSNLNLIYKFCKNHCKNSNFELPPLKKQTKAPRPL